MLLTTWLHVAVNICINCSFLHFIFIGDWDLARNPNSVLENVAINDVLSLKVTQHDAIANLVFLGPRDTSDQISMVSFMFSMQRHFMWFASAPFTSCYLAKFGQVPFARATPGNEAECKIYGEWAKSPVLF